jgi:outer membrane immunogenic protein
MKTAYLLPLAFLTLATPAAAQDFQGVRIEARLGYDWNGLEATYGDAIQTAQVQNQEDGLVFGGELGYDFQVSPGFILGVYAGADFSDADFCRQVAAVEQACLEVRRNLYIGARAGAQIGRTTLIYGKAGYSNGQARINFHDVDNLVDDLVDRGSRDGWHFGIGVEQNFTPNFYGKLEFVHTIYSDLDFVNPDYTVTVDGNRSQVIGALGLRF